MLETRALFIGSGEGLVRWHPCRCHIGDMQVMQVGQEFKVAHTCVSKLGRKSVGQNCKRCEKCEGCGKCEWSSHMCDHTFRLRRGFSKVIKVMKWV